MPTALKRHSLLLFLLVSALVGCRASAQSAAVPSAIPPAQPTVARPTSMPATTPPDPVTATALPPARPTSPTTLTPTAETPIARIDRLPLDQVWVWAPTAACNYRGGMVSAISKSGVLQQLQTPVIAVIGRPAGSPLLVTCAVDTFAIVATDTWTRLPLAVPAGTLLQSFLVSPDGTQLAFNAAPAAPPNASRKSDSQLLQTVNLQTGVLRTIINTDKLHQNRSNDAPYDLIEPIAWRAQMLYTHMQSSATSVFWRLDLAQLHVVIHKELHIGSTGLWAASPVGNALVWSDSYDQSPPRLRDLSTGAEQPLDGAADAAFSPDGTHLAVIRTTADGQCCRSMLAELTDTTPMLHGQPQPVGGSTLIQGLHGVRWSADSRYVLMPTQAQDASPIQVLVLTRDGAVVGSVALPHAVIGDLGLLNGKRRKPLLIIRVIFTIYTPATQNSLDVPNIIARLVDTLHTAGWNIPPSEDRVLQEIVSECLAGNHQALLLLSNFLLAGHSLTDSS